MSDLCFDVNTVHNVSSTGGCNKNLKELLTLIEEWSVEKIGGRYEIQT